MSKLLKEQRIVDPVLTQLARGYSNAEMIAHRLFPFVTVGKEAGKVPQFGKEAFKLYNSKRAIRARSNRVVPEGIATIPFETEEHDLEYPIDYREKNEAMFSRENQARKVTQNGIFLIHEKDCADLAQDDSNYDAANKVTLSGTDQWTDYSNSDPVGDVEAGKAAVRAKIGREPNLMVMGYSVYNKLKLHTKLLEKIKYSMKEILTLELLQEIFGISMVVGKSIYSTDAGAFVDLWKDNVILAWVPTAAKTYDEPSYGYTLRLKGHPWVDKYVENGGKIELIRSTDNFVPKMVGAEAGFLIKDTNA